MRRVEELVEGALHQASVRGVRFLVDDQDRITVPDAEWLSEYTRHTLRTHWRIAKAEILRREHRLRALETVPCAGCGTAIAKWEGDGLWVPGFSNGWGAEGWVHMGQAHPVVGCRSCGTEWHANFPDSPERRKRAWPGRKAKHGTHHE